MSANLTGYTGASRKNIKHEACQSNLKALQRVIAAYDKSAKTKEAKFAAILKCCDIIQKIILSR